MRISDWSSDVCSSDLPRVEGSTARSGGISSSSGIFIEGQPCRLRIALGTVSNGRKEYADGKASVRQWSFGWRGCCGDGRMVPGLGPVGVVWHHRPASYCIRPCQKDAPTTDDDRSEER